MSQAVAMSCPFDSPWGEIRFEALNGANGYRVQLTRDGDVLAADWVASSADLITRWQNVRERLGAVVAQAQDPDGVTIPGAGGPWWGNPGQLPIAVAATLR